MIDKRIVIRDPSQSLVSVVGSDPKQAIHGLKAIDILMK